MWPVRDVTPAATRAAAIEGIADMSRGVTAAPPSKSPPVASLRPLRRHARASGLSGRWDSKAKFRAPPLRFPHQKNRSISGATIAAVSANSAGSASATEGIATVGCEPRRRSNLTQSRPPLFQRYCFVDMNIPPSGLIGSVVPGPMPVISTITSSSLAPSQCTAFAG